MAMNVLTLIVLGFSIVLPFIDGSVIVLQAEDMLGAVSEIIPRSHASEQQSVHLYTGDSIETELCFTTDTKITVNEIKCSNDGPSDRIQVTLDELVLDEFKTISVSNFGEEWNVFRSYRSKISTVTKGGRHILKVTVLKSDRYGVEIDFIKFSVNDSYTLETVRCKSVCSKDNSHPYCNNQDMSLSGSARAVQRSVQTKCAEEDNINIPVFHDSASSLSFVVTASLPKYRSFQNNRDPDWTDCQMTDAFWRYNDIVLSQSHVRQAGLSTLHISEVTPEVVGMRHVWVIEADFELEGPSTGSIDSEIGAFVYLQNIRFDGILTVQFQYYNRYNIWSDKEVQIVKNGESDILFVTPDFSFRQGKENKVKIEIYPDLNTQSIITIGDFYMYKRTLKPDKTSTLYQDGATIIEGVDIDMWWRINETMSVTIEGKNQTFNYVDYIRIHQRVPWTESDLSEVFVLYQDANIRLLPTTPHGLDYIPFGSSVIIGQTNPLSNRPCSPISRVHIDPVLLEVTIYFMDSNIITLTIQTTMSETQLHVSDAHFVKDVNVYPFFTFRSMYVADDNNDVDHISVDNGEALKISDQWNEIRGNLFVFYRQWISKHNTQSPDISLRIVSSE